MKKLSVNQLREQRSQAKSRAYVNKVVARGAKALDKVEPGWAKRLNATRFDITNGAHCVLGQVFKAKARRESGYTYAYANDTLAGSEAGLEPFDTIIPPGQENASGIRAYPRSFYASLTEEAWLAEAGKRRARG